MMATLAAVAAAGRSGDACGGDGGAGAAGAFARRVHGAGRARGAASKAGVLQLSAVVLDADGTAATGCASDSARCRTRRSSWASASRMRLLAQGAAELIAASRKADGAIVVALEGAVKPEIRELFDEQLEVVLPELPQQVRDFMEDVPLVVEDYPSREVMRRMRSAASVAFVRAVHGHSAHQAEREPLGRAVGRDSYLPAGDILSQSRARGRRHR